MSTKVEERGGEEAGARPERPDVLISYSRTDEAFIRRLHWDVLSDSLTEVILTGAIGDGATSVGGKPPESLPVDDLKVIEEYIKRVQPPRYPFAIDRGLLPRGKAVFDEHCASCHEFGGSRTGTVIPLDEIGTDRHRLDMWTSESAKRYNAYAATRTSSRVSSRRTATSPCHSTVCGSEPRQLECRACLRHRPRGRGQARAHRVSEDPVTVERSLRMRPMQP